jgi:PPOX class probable FMN-dependent enzyme
MHAEPGQPSEPRGGETIAPTHVGPAEAHVVRRLDDLTPLYGTPPDHVIERRLDHLCPHCRSFIAKSPFLVIGSGDPATGLDVSPRGDPPGFVHVLDDRTLVIPDRPGNNRIDSLRNILVAPNIGILFLIPGVDEVLRVNGRAVIDRSPSLLQATSINGRLPTLVIRVAVAEAFLHCGKSLKRSRLWFDDYRVARTQFPTLAQMTADQIGADAERRASIESKIAENYANRMY